MKITKEIELSKFDFWGNAAENAAKLTEEQFDTIEACLEDCDPEDGWDESSINDLFAYDFDSILSWLPFEDAAHIVLDEIDNGIDHEDLVSEFADDMGRFCYVTESKILKEYQTWINEQSEIRAIEHINLIVGDGFLERVERVIDKEDDIEDYIEGFVEDFMGNHEFFTIDPCINDFLDSITEGFFEYLEEDEKKLENKEKSE